MENQNTPVSSGQMETVAPEVGGAKPNSTQGEAASNIDASAPKKAEPKAEPELHEVQINGKTKKLTLQQIKNLASMSDAAQERFEEAARIRKEHESFKQAAGKNMVQALRDQGFSNEQIREQMEAWYMEQFIEPETLTPEQRKIKEYEMQLKKYQEAEEAKRKEQEDLQLNELTSKQTDYVSSQIIEAMEKAGLPKLGSTASRIAFYMLQSNRNGWEAPLDVIVQHVKDEQQQLRSSEIGQLEGEELVSYLGEDIVNKIRKHDLANLRARKQNALAQTSLPNGHSKEETGHQKLSPAEVKRRLRDMTSGFGY
jgi:hypothetical protein